MLKESAEQYRSCTRKRRYNTRREARKAAKRVSRQTRSLLLPYPCFYCGGYHIGHSIKV
jgi:hypothetical protein